MPKGSAVPDAVFAIPGDIDLPTGGYAYDRRVLDGLGLSAHEKIAAFVHIGRPARPPEDRPRPALADIVTRFG